MKTIKTAISIDESLFRSIERLAQQLKIPRSQVFALAAEEFVKRYNKGKLLQRINDVHCEVKDEGTQRFLKAAKRKHQAIIGDDW